MTESNKAVFLSYASQDADAAGRICAALRAAGIEVWFDQSALRGGDAWDTAIRRQIKSCALFIPIISRNTHARDEGYFRLEWKLAVDRSHLMATTKAFLLPVVIDDTRDDDDRVPDRFREIQWTRLPGGAAPPAFADRVARLLAPDEPVASPAASSPGGAALAASAAAQATPSSSKILLVVIALLIVGVGYLAVDRFVLSTRTAGKALTPGASSQRAAPGAIPDRSIAVLPFADMSEKRDQEYFSDGLAEELLDLLAKTPGLHVIARTSSFYFKGKQATVAEIAKTLGVANILEGSVRKSGNRLRVTTQLIRTDTGEHIWSETYDRGQEDVFKIQDDIARVVVDKLRVTLLGDAPHSAAQTTNPDVHNLYLQGRYFVASDTRAGTDKAIECYRRAISLDGRYAPAYAGLAHAVFRQVANGYIGVDEGLAKAMAAAQRSVELDPALADGYVMIGSLRMSVSFDWAGAREAFDHALRLDPSSANALFSSAHLTMTVGSTEETLAQFHRVLERDPLNLLYRRYVARVLLYAGRLDEAEGMVRQVLELSPSFPAAHYELGRILLGRGEVARAVAEFESESSSWHAFGLPLGYHAAGRNAEAAAALRTLVQHSAGSEFQVAEAYAYAGDRDQAFVWLDHAVERRDPGVQWLRGDPLLATLTGDPRYASLLRRLNLPP